MCPLLTLASYEWKKRKAEREANHERECTRVVVDQTGVAKSCRSSQRHNPAINGRVSTCKSCGARDCVLCNSPEHVNENCEEYITRMQQDHGAEEEATSKALESGYQGLESFGKKGKVGMKLKLPKPCPGCGTLIEREEKCPRIRCVACEMEFCIRCNAVYLGKGSVPELGNAAHSPECGHYHRTKEDKRFAKRKRGVEEAHDAEPETKSSKMLSEETAEDSDDE